MADFGFRTVHSTRHECVLETPTNWGELDKAMRAVEARLKHTTQVFGDDAVRVESRDGEIVLSWVEESVRPDVPSSDSAKPRTRLGGDRG